MTVTIIAAATYHSRKLGAYACWVECRQGTIQVSGSLPAAGSLLEAQHHALSIALTKVNQSPFTGVERIVIHCMDGSVFEGFKDVRPLDPAGALCRVLIAQLNKKYQDVVIDWIIDQDGYKMKWAIDITTQILKKLKEQPCN